jgi:hypothetical protein
MKGLLSTYNSCRKTPIYSRSYSRLWECTGALLTLQSNLALYVGCHPPRIHVWKRQKMPWSTRVFSPCLLQQLLILGLFLKFQRIQNLEAFKNICCHNQPLVWSHLEPPFSLLFFFPWSPLHNLSVDVINVRTPFMPYYCTWFLSLCSAFPPFTPQQAIRGGAGRRVQFARAYVTYQICKYIFMY